MTKANATVLTLVGWDDILSRPIYRRCPAPVPMNTSGAKRKKKSAVKLRGTNASPSVFHPPTPDEFKRSGSKIRLEDGGGIEDKGSKRRRYRAASLGKQLELGSPGCHVSEGLESKSKVDASVKSFSPDQPSDPAFDNESTNNENVTDAASLNSIVSDCASCNIEDENEFKAADSVLDENKDDWIDQVEDDILSHSSDSKSSAPRTGSHSGRNQSTHSSPSNTPTHESVDFGSDDGGVSYTKHDSGSVVTRAEDQVECSDYANNEQLFSLEETNTNTNGELMCTHKNTSDLDSSNVTEDSVKSHTESYDLSVVHLQSPRKPCFNKSETNDVSDHLKTSVDSCSADTTPNSSPKESSTKDASLRTIHSVECSDSQNHKLHGECSESELLMSPPTSNAFRQNTSRSSSHAKVTGSTSKLYELQSPMLLEYNRSTYEPSETDTVDISLFENLDADEMSCIDNRRSYGKANNKPNWQCAKRYSAEQKPNDSLAGQKQLVGWDEIKCRPIYHVIKPDLVTDKLKSDDPVESTSDVENEMPKVHMKHKRRVYSSTFKKTLVFKAARHNMDLDSPGARRVTLESEVQDDAAMSSNDSNCDEVFDLESHVNINHDPAESDNEEVENKFQPTSKSSIESARAFFRYLDSNHHLTLMSFKETNENHTSTTLTTRTIRKIKQNNQLRDEYGKYCQTVQETGIDPISIDEFAKHWNLYFTERGIIRDGLLDED